MTTSTTRGNLNKLLKAAAALAFWLLVWQLAAWKVGLKLLIPGPAEVARTLMDLAVQPDFWRASGLSLLRIFAGFAAGAVLGAAFAVLTCAFKTADTLVSPVIRVIRATPVASFIILALLFIGASQVPAFISMLMVTPVVWGNVERGIRETDVQLLEMAGAYRLSGLRKARLLYLPSAMPYFSSGCVTSLGLAWKSGVAAEVLCLPKQSIGTQLYFSKIYLETPALFAWTAVVIILSFVLEKLISAGMGRVK